MSQIKGLLFDKDGTLFDFAATWEAWAHAFLNRLCEGDDAQARLAGQAIGFDFDSGKFARDSIVIAGMPEEIAQILLPFFPDMALPTLLGILDDEAALAPQREAVPLRPLLTALSARGICLGVATNDSEGPARAHLEAAGVTDLFSFIAGSDSGFGGKPGPGQMQAFAAQAGLQPGDVAMIGDSTHDLHAGRAAGMTTIAVLTGLATRADLAPYADVVLPDIGHLPEWLETRATHG